MRGMRKLVLFTFTLLSLTALNIKAEEKEPISKQVEPTSKKEAGEVKRAPLHLDKPNVIITLADKLVKKDQFVEAENAYWAILHSEELSIEDEKTALLGLAHLYRKEASQKAEDSIALTKALAIYEKFLKEFPDDERLPDVLLDLGRTQRQMGAYAIAINRFYSVINSTLKFPKQDFDHYQSLAKTAQFEIAQTYFESGDYTEAARFFKRVEMLELSQTDAAHASFMVAYADQQIGDLEAAVAALKTYIHKFPNDGNVPQARYLLATTLKKLNKDDEALGATLLLLDEINKQSTANPKLWSYWKRKAGNALANNFFQGGNFNDALKIYQSLNKIDPDSIWQNPVSYQLGLCYLRLGKKDQAKAEFSKIIEASKKSAASGKTDPELTQLVTLCNWHLSNINWNKDTTYQIDSYFSRPDPVVQQAAQAAQTEAQAPKQSELPQPLNP